MHDAGDNERAGFAAGCSRDFVLDIQAGPELAVAATKTYTSELMVIAMLSAALKGDESAWNALAKVPAWVNEALGHDQAMAKAVEHYKDMRQCVVLGRGDNYSTTFEWAL